MEAREHTQANLELLREKLDSGRMRSASIMANSLHPSELARLLESLPLKDRAHLWEIVDPRSRATCSSKLPRRFVMA